jgi:hypothetical protein
MSEQLQEFCDSRGVRMRVDRESGVIRGVKILGLKSRNGRTYAPEALAAAAALYDNAKVNVNHPQGHPAAPRDYRDRLGQIRGVALRPGEGLFGDLHFNPKHALAEQLLWDASHAPENVGLSHNVAARTSRQGGQTVVEAILTVQSVDLVADPATTRGLYESASGMATAQNEQLREALTGLTLEQLHASRPDLVDTVRGEAAARIRALQAELDRLQVREALHERRAVVARLLKEFKLPDPDLADAATRPIVSAVFLETLLSAPDESTMRDLVAERAEMVATARRLDRARFDRPISREQHRGDGNDGRVRNAEEFARAIS